MIAKLYFFLKRCNTVVGFSVVLLKVGVKRFTSHTAEMTSEVIIS